jgi:hypothetical protein
MKGPVLFVEPGRGGLPAPFQGVDGLVSIDQDELTVQTLVEHRGAIFPMHLDQRRVSAWSREILAWLVAGGRLFLSGNTAYEVVPGLLPFRRLDKVSPPHLGIAQVASHPVFDAVAPERVQDNSGVQGFYARGHVPPLPGARIIRTIDHGRAPCDWELAWPGRGRLLVHASNDPWTTGTDRNDRRRFAAALVAWLAAEE